ncbi:GGDEF domain-containing protein [Ferrigenium kumadai]|uniref:diguanylate cyclase n=1 Tax=Ferrigenium kumadai TaxID=1682490 RepID=A0AAN1SZE1_9PROT|nr:GGDEF domain-containing protein [Ferrigenium kumadai]BBI98925.1 GGDEF domain-containing protein [Ferrigenium kumadai]
MKYSRERAASAEILRLALQKMASHPAAFTPPNYAVWYDYLTGINPALSEAMNNRLSSDTKLDDDTIEKFYAQYVSESGADVQQVLRKDIKQLLSKLAGFTAETDRQALHFGSSLQTYGDALKGSLGTEELDSLINTMADDTDKMRGSMQQLQAQLEASKQQVEKLNQELESARGEAVTDPLTGVLNRRGFEIRTQALFADEIAIAKGLCLLMIDIDHFKKINDTYGHLFGDKVISAVANTLKSKVKGQDAVARLGGEEFAVLLPETNLAGALVVAEHIRQSIESGKIRRVDGNDQIGGITISIGVAAHAKGGGLVELMNRADKALYVSKQSGRNRATVFGQ